MIGHIICVSYYILQKDIAIEQNNVKNSERFKINNCDISFIFNTILKAYNYRMFLCSTHRRILISKNVNG